MDDIYFIVHIDIFKNAHSIILKKIIWHWTWNIEKYRGKPYLYSFFHHTEGEIYKIKNLYFYRHFSIRMVAVIIPWLWTTNSFIQIKNYNYFNYPAFLIFYLYCSTILEIWFKFLVVKFVVIFLFRRITVV